MKRLFFLLALSCSVASLRAADQDAVNAKLREGLRNTMIQLRDAQTQVATLQATQTEDEQKIKDLTAKLEQTSKQASDDKLAADKTISDLKEQVKEQDSRNAQQVELIGKWKTAYGQLLAQAQSIDAKRAQLVSQNIMLQRKVDDQQRKNWAMYQLGLEILKRYEHFGLGDAITAREPFVGTTRVKFENLIQDYGDKLAAQKINQ